MQRNKTLSISNKPRFAAALCGALLLLATLFSVFYIAREADHDCTGEDCPVCLCIEQCTQHIRQLSDGAPAAAAVLVTVILSLFLISFQRNFRISQTLISQKVRLNP